MVVKHKNFNSFYRLISIVYMAILVGYVIFMTTIYFLYAKQHISLPENSDRSFLYLSLILGVILYFVKGVLIKVFNRFLPKKQTVSEKLSLYFTFLIINVALMEAYGSLNVVLFMLYHNLIFFIFAAYALLLMLFLKPNPVKISGLLQLTAEEQVYIDQPDKPFS